MTFGPEQTARLADLWHQADRQYENAMSEECVSCKQKNIWRKIGWARRENAKLRRMNDDPIIIKYCKACRDARRQRAS